MAGAAVVASGQIAVMRLNLAGSARPYPQRASTGAGTCAMMQRPALLRGGTSSSSSGPVPASSPALVLSCTHASAVRVPPATRARPMSARAEYRDGSSRGGGGGGFVAGLLLGGVVGGALAYIFAPQLSKTILGEDADGSTRRLPKWLGEDDSLEATRRKMNEKLAELNRAIDRTSAEILGEGLEEGERRGDSRVPDSRAVESIDAI